MALHAAAYVNMGATLLHVLITRPMTQRCYRVPFLTHAAEACGDDLHWSAFENRQTP